MKYTIEDTPLGLLQDLTQACCFFAREYTNTLINTSSYITLIFEVYFKKFTKWEMAKGGSPSNFERTSTHSTNSDLGTQEFLNINNVKLLIEFPWSHFFISKTLQHKRSNLTTKCISYQKWRIM